MSSYDHRQIVSTFTPRLMPPPSCKEAPVQQAEHQHPIAQGLAVLTELLLAGAEHQGDTR